MRVTPPVVKLAISMPPDLMKAAMAAAARTHKGNVSAWMTEAARQELRNDAGLRLMAELDKRFGPISEEKYDEAGRKVGW